MAFNDAAAPQVVFSRRPFRLADGTFLVETSTAAIRCGGPDARVLASYQWILVDGAPKSVSGRSVAQVIFGSRFEYVHLNGDLFDARRGNLAIKTAKRDKGERGRGWAQHEACREMARRRQMEVHVGPIAPIGGGRMIAAVRTELAHMKGRKLLW